MATIIKDLGPVSAYAYAVTKGYTGTEEEFAELMADYADVGQTAVEAAQTATTKASEASASASTASTAAGTATTKAAEATTSAGTAATNATTALNAASQAAQSATQASASATAAQTAQTAAETAQTAAETAQGKAEQAAATLTVDSALSDSSTNPVQNKVVKGALDEKANVDGSYESLTAGNAEQLVSTVFVEDETPYNFRTSGGSADIGDRLYDKIVGGTVAWNQLVKINNGSVTNRGITATIDANGVISLSGISENSYTQVFASFNAVAGHKYMCTVAVLANPNNATLYVRAFNIGWVGGTNMCSADTTRPTGCGISGFNVGENLAGVKLMGNIFDLTQMFGPTIADYIYSLETATPGAGIAWFRKLFPKDYYAYNAGTLQSVQAASHDMVGFNAYDPTTGTAQLVGGMQYQITGTYTALTMNGETITPDASGYFTPSANGILTVTGGNSADTCVHLVWDGERDGEYEPYVKHAYPLDDSLTLRGIPKLDGSNNLYYDGDEYEADGMVKRRYAAVDLGTLNYTYQSDNLRFASSGVASLIKKPATSSTIPNVIAAGYTAADYVGLTNNKPDFTVAVYHTSGDIYIINKAYTDAATFKTAMSGVYLVYELATPTTESADPFQSPQIVDDFGAEEYVDAAVAAGSRDVSIPVGHVTKYANNLRAKLEMAPESPDGDGDYIVRQNNGTNEYISISDAEVIQGITAKLPAPPTTDGTYKLTVTVTSGTPVYTWEAET